jgi:hypothetical protein
LGEVVGVGVGVAVGVGVGVAVGVGSVVGVGSGVGVADGGSVGVGLADGVALGVALAVAEGEGVLANTDSSSAVAAKLPCCSALVVTTGEVAQVLVALRSSTRPAGAAAAPEDSPLKISIPAMMPKVASCARRIVTAMFSPWCRRTRRRNLRARGSRLGGCVPWMRGRCPSPLLTTVCMSQADRFAPGTIRHLLVCPRPYP